MLTAIIANIMSDWLEEFHETIEQASIRLSSLPDEKAATPPAPGKWSPKEVIGHLIDSAANNHQRFVRAQFSDDLVFPGYEQEAWVETQRYNDEPWLQLVQLWRHYNLHLCHVMSVIPIEIRNRPRSNHNLDRISWKTVSTEAPVTLEYFMQDYVAHLRNHLNQILD
jgi:hypothetical protein